MICSGERRAASLPFLCRVFVASRGIRVKYLVESTRGFYLLRDLPQPFSPPHGIRVEFTIYVYAYATSFVESWRNISLTQAQLCTMEKLKIQLKSFQGIKLNNTRYAGTKRISRGK